MISTDKKENVYNHFRISLFITLKFYLVLWKQHEHIENNSNSIKVCNEKWAFLLFWTSSLILWRKFLLTVSYQYFQKISRYTHTPPPHTLTYFFFVKVGEMWPNCLYQVFSYYCVSWLAMYGKVYFYPEIYHFPNPCHPSHWIWVGFKPFESGWA